MTIRNAINNIQFTSVNIVTFTASGTYTPPANLLWAQVECVGGGGGSAGVPAPGSIQCIVSSSGGSGGYAKKMFSRSSLTPNVAVTIGAGGAGGAAGANPGNPGGNTTFQGVSAGGGQQGAAGTIGASSFVNGGAGGTATGGDFNLAGGTGAAANLFITASQVTTQNAPASTASIYSSGNEFPVDGLGANGALYGGGASGVNRWNPGGTGSAAGRNGASGIVIITEYLRA